MPKGFIQKQHVQRKEYVYTLDGVKLSFTLRQDVKKEMVDFKSLMEKAIKEIEEDIAKVPTPNGK